MFTEDLTPLFDATHGFAVYATYKGQTIPVIYDEDYYAASGQDVDIESAKPAAVCRTTDVSGVKIGDDISVDGEAFVVINAKPDGTGVTVLALEYA